MAVITPFVLIAFLSAPAQRRLSSPGVYEGEDLVRAGKASTNAGTVSSQAMAGFGAGWSGNAQLFWGGGQPGAVLDLIIEVTTPAKYGVELHMTRAPDYAQLQIQVDGKAAATAFDGYAPNVVPSGAIHIGGFDLSAGSHKLSFLITGKHPNSSGFLVGIDRVRLTTTTVASASQTSTGATSSSDAINATRLGLRTRLEIWNGIHTVDNAPLTFGKDAVFGQGTTQWLWFFRWSTTVPGAKSAVLVASRQEPVASDPPLAPPGFVGLKEVPDGIPPSGVNRDFKLDLESWVPPPPSGRSRLALSSRLYMSIVLLDDNGQPIGPPSTAVTLTRGSRQGTIDTAEVIAAAEKVKAETEAKRAKASIFEVKILSHKPVTFPDPNRWGCIIVVKNPYYLKALHPLMQYQPGHEYCPPTDPSTQEKSTWEWIGTAIAGWGKAYDGLAHFYDEAKNYVATQFANTVPCKWLGKKLEDDCKDAARQLAGTAISVGLVAAGVPPTLPDLGALGDLGKGKVVDAAVGYTCDAFESQGGMCTPEMREQLAKLYQQALDELLEGIKRDGKEPDCGDGQTANEHGKLPLPCFTQFPGTDVKPASGSVYEPSMVTVRVTRVKPDPDFIMPGCSVFANVNLQKEFKGGWFGGWYAKPGLLSGEAFVEQRTSIPPLALGKSVDLTLLFTRTQKHSLPGLYQPDYVGWQNLYVGGKGSLIAGAITDKGVPLPSSPNVPQIIGCGKADQWNVEIPK